ncbi:MAG: two-component system response regulator [Hyphomonadaceae bacterium]
MDMRDWAVCIVDPNKYEGQIAADLLRFSGVQRIRTVTDSADALDLLRFYPATIIIMELDSTPIDGLAFVRRLRRDHEINCRKAPVFIVTKKMSRAVAEACRIAGANALIGKPISGSTLMGVIKKVLANPRPFVEVENYVGPCRRAGIVTANSLTGRREADRLRDGGEAPPMDNMVAALRGRIEELITGKTQKTTQCESALQAVQQAAVSAGDGPMMRACAAFSLQLANSGKLDGVGRAALGACMDGMTRLAANEDGADRESVAEEMRQAVARAASRRAA